LAVCYFLIVCRLVCNPTTTCQATQLICNCNQGRIRHKTTPPPVQVSHPNYISINGWPVP
jgi:hypothetical protein